MFDNPVYLEPTFTLNGIPRSEERRVGKEC